MMQLHYVFFVAMIYLSHGDMDPHYMVNGHIFSQYYHGSIMYWSMAMSWVSLHQAWVCSPWDDIYEYCLMTYYNLQQVLLFSSLHITFFHVFRSSHSPLTYYFEGHMLHTKMPHFLVAHLSITIGTFKYCNCRICNCHTQIPLLSIKERSPTCTLKWHL